MKVTIELSPDREAAFKARAKAMGLSLEEWLLWLAEQAGPIQASAAVIESRPIWEVILDNMKDVPAQEFEKLPKDGASEHDHYLYGHPKRNQ